MSDTCDVDAWHAWAQGELDDLVTKNLIRSQVAVEYHDGVHVSVDGQRMVLFSGNDYLGLSGHSDVRHAAAQACEQFGFGPRGSPLICGQTSLHAALESRLARLKAKDEALLFPTGFAANLAVLTALSDDQTAIFSDALNHASIIDGCRQARRHGAEVHIYNHADVEHLESMLKASQKARKLIITDSVFSMDGDIAPLRELVMLKRRFGALLAVDDAHGTLVFGERGGGAGEMLDVEDDIDIHVGTLSKAFGCQGGFIACSMMWKRLLLNRSRTYIYSTALPVPVVAGAYAALDVFERYGAELQQRLQQHVRAFEKFLDTSLQSPIIPIVIGDEVRTLELSRNLKHDGFHIVAIRPPTVPQNTSRLRITCSAAHSSKNVDAIIAALKHHGVGPRE